MTKDDKVLISPLNEVGVVKSVVVDCVAGWQGFAGDHVTIGMVGPDINSLTPESYLNETTSA